MEPKINKRLELISVIAEGYIATAMRKSQGRNSIVLDYDSFLDEMKSLMVLCDTNDLAPERENWFEDLDDNENNIWSR
jgi:hypothetical protein